MSSTLLLFAVALSFFAISTVTEMVTLFAVAYDVILNWFVILTVMEVVAIILFAYYDAI